MSKLTFRAIRAQQSEKHQVFSFAATAAQIMTISSIEHIARDARGGLTGFQRPQIASHIHQIRDYLRKDDAVLPNPIVLAFVDGVVVRDLGDGIVELTVDDASPKGLVVDGQQRLTALSGLPDKNFQVFVSALICKDEDELRKQFILINNTRPLPKSLIYELLPTVSDLPEQMSSRSLAAKLTEALNYNEDSSLFGQIRQHTNPDGVINDAAIQRLIMASLSDGVCRELIRLEDGEERCVRLISNFFAAVQLVFADEWGGRTPKSSRLVHGAGIQAMGYVMEFLHARDGYESPGEFVDGLRPLAKYTAWTKGEWHFGEGERRPWNTIQNLHRDIQLLASYLTRVLKQAERRRELAEAIND